MDECSTLKLVLVQYEVVSGQAINMTKSSISYSPNESVAVFAKIFKIF